MKAKFSALALAAALFAAPGAQAQTEIQWWHSMGGALGEALNGLANKFNLVQKEYKVVPTFKGSYPESMTAAIAAFRAGNAPHILQVFEVGTATMMASKGAIVPVNEVMKLAGQVNQYLSEQEPWKVIKTDRERAATILYVALRCVDSLKTLMTPFLPFTSQKLHELLGYDGYIAGPLLFRDPVANSVPRFGRNDVGKPISGGLRVGSRQDLDNVSILKLMLELNDPAVDLRTRTGVADFRVNGVSKVDGTGSAR